MDAPLTRPALFLTKLILYPRQVATVGMEGLANRSAIYEVDEPDGQLVLVFQVPRGGIGGELQVALTLALRSGSLSISQAAKAKAPTRRAKRSLSKASVA